MNRDHQRICPRCGTSPLADDERCWNCNYPLELAGGATAAVAFARVGDSTPPAEPPDENWFQRQARLAARDVQLLPPWLRSHPPAVSGEGERFDFRAHLQRQREFSERTFGPGSRAQGVVAHIRKELNEIEADPGDLSEWIDVAILALDGAWRSGASPADIIAALVAKQTKNEARKWPDWRTASPDAPIEHDRSGECASAPTPGAPR